MNLIISSATGRSGSTLLQRIFNSRKETLIWGEHSQCLTSFYDIYKRLSYKIEHHNHERENYFKYKENPNQKMANMNPDHIYLEKAIISSIQSFFNQFYDKYSDTHDILGFKEIMYGYNELELFSKCYPKCTIILLIRNPLDIWKSMSGGGNYWSISIEQFIEIWNNNAADYVKLDKSYSTVYLIRYEDMIAEKKDTIETLCELGGLKPSNIRDVLAHKMGSTQKRMQEKHLQMISNSCKNLMDLFDYS